MKYINCKYCGVLVELRTKKKNVNEILKVDKNKKFCSLLCLNNWQKETKWEDVIGVENADKIRKDASLRVSGKNNPSCDKKVANKISKSLKKYLKENPRYGNKNPFYNKKHTDETKQFLSDSKKNIRSYNEDGYKKLYNNTPRGDKHPNWVNGNSITKYKNFTNVIKNNIKILDNYTCKICGKKTQKLAIHHIDYNKYNSVEDNLISLCYSCHSKTNFNRDSWIIFFEPIIQKRKSL